VVLGAVDIRRVLCVPNRLSEAVYLPRHQQPVESSYSATPQLAVIPAGRELRRVTVIIREESTGGKQDPQISGSKTVVYPGTLCLLTSTLSSALIQYYRYVQR
jgi:hypothetical protein